MYQTCKIKESTKESAYNSIRSKHRAITGQRFTFLGHKYIIKAKAWSVYRRIGYVICGAGMIAMFYIMYCLMWLLGN